MITDKEIIIKVNNRYLKKYEELGYGKLKQGDFIILQIEHLPLNSCVIVNVMCCFCKNIFKKKYSGYIEIINRKGKYCCKKCTPIEYRKTCLEKYGVDNITKLPETHNKIKKTNLKRHGEYSYAKTDEYKERYKKTCLEKYGIDNYSKTEKFKESCKKTCLEKYGVENSSQDPDIFSKQQKRRYEIKKYLETELYYQGTYEKDFLDNYYNKIEISKIDSIDYTFNNKNKRYFPDFYIQKYNLIVEIKSSYTYNRHKEQNISKEKECISQGYNFVFIINKNYSEFEKIIN